MNLIVINTKLKALQCCVIIPTYNNYKTLKRVIDGVLVFTNDIIIVNDGSTDSTAEILKGYPQLQQITLPKNRGKGNALRLGFKQAEKLGFQYAITIDSDGQHFPEDIQVFVEALEKEENKNVLLIGARNMSQQDVPKKSSFGNNFSNFWYWVETGGTRPRRAAAARAAPRASPPSRPCARAAPRQCTGLTRGSLVLIAP
jgi:glycosyltransferase involved in cell wall biosynthesis